MLVLLAPAGAASAAGEERGAGRAPSTTELLVHVDGCRARVRWEVNHSRQPVAGSVAYTWLEYSPTLHRWVPWGHPARKPERDIDDWTFGAGESGLWRFRARFLGDSDLRPSPVPAQATFRIDHTCGPPQPPTERQPPSRPEPPAASPPQ